jgi:S-(hydroxymethyl)glutathione dehydrogenase/alcohol dehydrogenase
MKIKFMTAAILEHLNQPLVVDSVELPDNLDFGQVLVQVHYSGICGSQLGELTGVKGADPYLPHLLGHEGSGIVIETGLNVTKVKSGDHVVLHWRPGEGIQSQTPKYKWRTKTLNAGYVTTFNDYAVVSENRLTPIPKNYPLDLAPLYGCAVTTGFGVIENNAKLKMGESIIIFGAGGIGLNIVQAASLYNAFPIIAVDQFENRLELAKEIGATHCINNKTDGNYIKAILDIVGNNGANIVIDNTGNNNIISICYDLTSPQGRTILVGVPTKGKKTSIYTLPLHFGRVITGSHGGNGNPNEDIPRYMKVEENNKMSLSSLVTSKFLIKNINKAIDGIRDGSISGRVMIDMINK